MIEQQERDSGESGDDSGKHSDPMYREVTGEEGTESNAAGANYTVADTGQHDAQCI